MALPTPTVEIAFGDNWDDTSPTWVDVTSYLRAVNFDRRFSWETGLYQGGRCTVVLNDSTRLFDPMHASGTYYGDFVPGTQVRVRATYSGTTYTLWRGFVQRWRRTYSRLGSACTTAEAADGWSQIANVDISGSQPSELVSVRMAAILNACGWGAWRTIETSTIYMPAVTQVAKASTWITQCVDVEQGAVYVDRNGEIVFAARDQIADARIATTDQATLSDVAADSSVIRYNSVELEFGDEAQLVNAATFADQTSSDSTSIARHGRRWLDRSSVDFEKDVDALAAATMVVAARKDPVVALPPLVFDVMSAASTEMQHACLRDLRDRVRWKHTPTGGGSGTDIDAHIVGIAQTWTAEPASWSVAWELADAALVDRLNPSNWLILDDASKGQLDQEVLGY